MTRFFRRTPPFRVLLGIGGVVGLGMVSIGAPETAPTEVGPLDAVVVEPAEEISVYALGEGETLGDLLASVVEPGVQHRLLLAFREQADPRRLRVGTEVALRFRPDELALEGGSPRLRGVDVALDPDNTLRLTRGGIGWTSDLIRTATWTDTIYAAGEIEDVLWNAVVRNPALEALPTRDRIQLIHGLDEIFQWQVDFSRQIQRGDRYRFAFERRVRPDGSMRSARILAAEIENAGTSYHAVWFDPHGDGPGNYFDPEGNSVRRAFLLKPLEFRRISSRFSRSRFHPILKTWRAHQGVDYAASRGTEIMATGDGVVTHRGPRGGLGNAVIIRHTNQFRTRYGHMSRFHPDVRVGTRVRQGQVIGYVGESGLATAPHLHYELWQRGSPVDPLTIDLPPGDPVPDSARARWEREATVRMALLDGLRGEGVGRFARNAAPEDEASAVEGALGRTPDREAVPDAPGGG